MNNPLDYKAIQLWGNRLYSFQSYITATQQEAAAEGAPIDAIYKRGDVWVTLRDVTNKDVLKEARKQGLIA